LDPGSDTRAHGAKHKPGTPQSVCLPCFLTQADAAGCASCRVRVSRNQRRISARPLDPPHPPVHHPPPRWPGEASLLSCRGSAGRLPRRCIHSLSHIPRAAGSKARAAANPTRRQNRRSATSPRNVSVFLLPTPLRGPSWPAALFFGLRWSWRRVEKLFESFVQDEAESHLRRDAADPPSHAFEKSSRLALCPELSGGGAV